MVTVEGIYNGNSCELLKSITPESIDLVVTSPPYDGLRSYNGQAPFTWESFKLIAAGLKSVMKDGGVVVWIVGDEVIKGSESGSSFKQISHFMEEGFLLHDTMLYEKNTSSFPASAKGKRYTQIFEYMFILSKKIPPKSVNLLCDKPNKWSGWVNWGKKTHRENKDDVLISTKDIKAVPDFSPRNNIWKYNVGSGFGTKNKDVYKHPASFPEALAIDNVLSWSNPGDTVLDPFMGSGTTGVACKRFDRKFVGIELDETYFTLALKRISETINNGETIDTWVAKLKDETKKTDLINLIKTVSTMESELSPEDLAKKIANLIIEDNPSNPTKGKKNQNKENYKLFNGAELNEIIIPKKEKDENVPPLF